MMKKVKILLVEEDKNLGSILQEYLVFQGFEVVLCKDSQQGYKYFLAEHFDLCLLGIILSKEDGFFLARRIRKNNEIIPIIFLTEKSLEKDVLNASKVNADDYLIKPFGKDELLLRINAILRRTDENTNKIENKKVFVIDRFIFNYHEQKLEDQLLKTSVKLTSKENELLRLLCTHKNDILDRSYALKLIWHDDTYFNARSMDVYISKLRKYLKPSEKIEIINIHGKGFKFLVRED